MNFDFNGSIPEGVSVADNVALGSSIREICNNSILDEKMTTSIIFYGLVQSGGTMDYKTQGSEYENFGNYNYGAMAAAMGLDENFVKAGAAAQQVRNIMFAALQNGKEWLDNNLSPQDKEKYERYYNVAQNIKENNPNSYGYALFQYFLNESMRIGETTGNYGYLDDPKDQKYINDGYRDAKNNGYGKNLDFIEFNDFSKLNSVGQYIFGLDNGGSIQEFINDFKDFIGNIYNGINDNLKDLTNILGEHLDKITPQWIKDIIAQLYDPIALDLDGDGAISVISANDGSVYFDHDCDGVAFRSSWISSNDGLLVFDRNSNGTIDNGSELFGNFTPLSNSIANSNTDSSFVSQTQNDTILAIDDKFVNLNLFVA